MVCLQYLNDKHLWQTYGNDNAAEMQYSFNTSILIKEIIQ